jgi:Protein of unknown function (DUF2877)
VIRVTEIGWRAAAALARTGGGAHVLATLSRSTYLIAGDELVWLGPPGSTLHARAALAAHASDASSPLTTVPLDVPSEARTLVTLDTRGAWAWRAPSLTADADALRRNARTLAAGLASIGIPEGFGLHLVGAPLPSFLETARPGLEALADACDANDASAAAAAAAALLGRGPGLTPSGDDLVGGAFFARRLLVAVDDTEAAAWRAAADKTVALARERTHPISALLLADLAAGEGWAPLHGLAAALAAGASPEVVMDEAERLARIGQTSGWDLLTGFVVGLLGRSAFAVRSLPGLSPSAE